MDVTLCVLKGFVASMLKLTLATELKSSFGLFWLGDDDDAAAKR